MVSEVDRRKRKDEQRYDEQEDDKFEELLEMMGL